MRSAVIKSLRFREAGSGSWTTIPGRSIGEGSTIEPASPRETMANGMTRAAGTRYDVNITIKEAEKVAAFDAAFVAAPGAGDPADGLTDWDEIGAVEAGASITYNTESGEDSGRLRVFRSTQVQVVFEALDVTKFAVVSPMNETLVDVAFRRMDGSFKVFRGVLLTAEINPAFGVERMQTARIQLESEAVRDITDVSEGISSSHFAALNALQMAGKRLEIEAEYSDGSTVTLERVGFVATPVEPFGEETLEGVVIEGSAYGPTPGSVITVTPTLS